jgi:hypothetical protein
VVLLPDAVELAQKDNPLFRDFKIESRYRGDDPAWYEGWVDPRSSFGSQLMRTQGLDMVALTQCKAAMILTATIEEPSDLGYLQRAFLVLKLLAERANAVAACDVESLVWWTKADLEALPDGWDFDVADHSRVVFEAKEREPGAGHLCFSLGMAKFGRPDLAIGGLAREHAEAAGEMIENLATALAEGDNFETGDIVEPEGFPPLRCEEMADDSDAPDVTFGNRSIWLVPEEG